jgi:hypothetical protein
MKRGDKWSWALLTLGVMVAYLAIWSELIRQMMPESSRQAETIGHIWHNEWKKPCGKRMNGGNQFVGAGVLGRKGSWIG